MPVIGTIVKKQIVLPGYPESDPGIVTVIANPKGDALDGVDSSDAKVAQYQILAKIITEWNFTDKEKKVLEITPENIKLALSIFDLDVIHKALGLNAMPAGEKKS